MANAIKWEAAWSSRSTVLTTQLDALGASTRSVHGIEFDNSDVANLDQYGKLEIAVDFVTAPAAGGYFTINMITAPGGTNHDTGTDPGTHTIIANVAVAAADTAQIIMTPIFRLEPAKTYFMLYNGTTQPLPASGSTVTLYTCNDEVQ